MRIALTTSSEKRADTIKDHVESFYTHLKHDRVAAAVRENEAIEQLSTQLGESVTRRVNQPGTNQIDREWTDLRTANETAAQNWLALGQYLSIERYRNPGPLTNASSIHTPAQPNEPIGNKRREPFATWISSSFSCLSITRTTGQLEPCDTLHHDC